MTFYDRITRWYLTNKRDLPWRKTTDPYAIWLSEIMLQQTRVAQGLPYFERFISTFPTVFDLAKADEEQVLKLWQGLGYYSRARNMHKTAQIVVDEFEGIFPPSYKELLQLKGVGEYTAAAIASFSYNEKVNVVDGNVFRVIARYLNVTTDISSATAKKEFVALANELMENRDSALFNQAIMEFGALQCVPKNPNCSSCVLNESCAALQLKRVDQLPIKSKKTKVRNRFLNYLIFEDAEQNTMIRKRSEKGIWHNLYEFPVIETENEEKLEVVIDKIKQEFADLEINSVRIYDENLVHKLSHQNLTIRFFGVKTSQKLVNGLPISTINQFPFPIVLIKFIEKYLN
ncbi:MAG: A/G-specific adenine glycosylase [Flavobacterium sp.]|nr:A/G-specific adenine glycosylase [Flavobacterium sp.]